MRTAQEWIEDFGTNDRGYAMCNSMKIEAIQEDAITSQKERLEKLANLIWNTRWVSDEEDYQNMVGIAAEIRSGNFKTLDSL